MFIFLGHLALQVKFFKKKKVCSGETLEITLVDSLTVCAELLKCLSIFLCSFQNSYISTSCKKLMEKSCFKQWMVEKVIVILHICKICFCFKLKCHKY